MLRVVAHAVCTADVLQIRSDTRRRVARVNASRASNMSQAEAGCSMFGSSQVACPMAAGRCGHVPMNAKPAWSVQARITVAATGIKRKQGPDTHGSPEHVQVPLRKASDADDTICSFAHSAWQARIRSSCTCFGDVTPNHWTAT